jgi:lysine-specific demethylase 8
MILSAASAQNEVTKIESQYLPESKAEFIEKYLNKSQPVLFKGIAKTWKSSDWDLDFFAQKFYDVDVLIQTDENLSESGYGSVDTEYSQKTLKQYIDDIYKNGIKAGYLSQFDILDVHPGLQNALNFPRYYDSKYLERINLWIGPKGTQSKLHYDSDQNLFVQIYGKKIVTLISPDQSKKCYPVNITWYGGYSPIDVFEPDFTKYPLFANVKMSRYELEAGDMIYIPKWWWHDIRSTEHSISASLWWISWEDFIKELVAQFKYEYIDGNAFESKNSYISTFKKNLGLK